MGTTEWGVFNGEGLFSGGYTSEAEANATMADMLTHPERYFGETELDVDQVCATCHDGRVDQCDVCGDDDEHDGDDEDNDDDEAA